MKADSDENSVESAMWLLSEMCLHPSEPDVRSFYKALAIASQYIDTLKRAESFLQCYRRCDPIDMYEHWTELIVVIQIHIASTKAVMVCGSYHTCSTLPIPVEVALAKSRHTVECMLEIQDILRNEVHYPEGCRYTRVDATDMIKAVASGIVGLRQCIDVELRQYQRKAKNEKLITMATEFIVEREALEKTMVTSALKKQTKVYEDWKRKYDGDWVERYGVGGTLQMQRRALLDVLTGPRICPVTAEILKAVLQQPVPVYDPTLGFLVPASTKGCTM